MNLSGAILGQATLVSNYKLDNCSVQDYEGNNDGFILGTPCACGVEADGFDLNGSQFIDFGAGLSPIFSSDFSLSFYVQFDPMDSDPMDVFSVANACSRDSVFLMRYLPDFNLLSIIFSDSPANFFSIDAEIENPLCWNYVVFTLSGSTGQLYVNGDLVAEANSISPLSLMNGANLTLGNSPCVMATVPDSRFRGRIDEIQVYQGALTQREVVRADLKPDQIITPDTTIFIGESLALRTGQTCSNDFEWSPSAGLDDPFLLEPIATPEVGTHTYTLEVEYSGCRVTDDVTINVVDRQMVSCDDLMLPNTFTPNGDGVNDNFGISNIYLVESLNTFEVFDKWGGRIFGTVDINSTWNGLHNNTGDPAANSSYVYKVNYVCNGEEYTKSGVINVLR